MCIYEIPSPLSKGSNIGCFSCELRGALPIPIGLNATVPGWNLLPKRGIFWPPPLIGAPSCGVLVVLSASARAPPGPGIGWWAFFGRKLGGRTVSFEIPEIKMKRIWWQCRIPCQLTAQALRELGGHDVGPWYMVFPGGDAIPKNSIKF